MSVSFYRVALEEHATEAGTITLGITGHLDPDQRDTLRNRISVLLTDLWLGARVFGDSYKESDTKMPSCEVGYEIRFPADKQPSENGWEQLGRQIKSAIEETLQGI